MLEKLLRRINLLKFTKDLSDRKGKTYIFSPLMP